MASVASDGSGDAAAIDGGGGGAGEGSIGERGSGDGSGDQVENKDLRRVDRGIRFVAGVEGGLGGEGGSGDGDGSEGGKVGGTVVGMHRGPLGRLERARGVGLGTFRGSSEGAVVGKVVLVSRMGRGPLSRLAGGVRTTRFQTRGGADGSSNGGRR